MGCYHPLKAFELGVKDNGKKELKVVPYATDHLELFRGTWRQVPLPEASHFAERICRSYVEIPCGNCIGCRLDYSRVWADRCVMEMSYHEESCFITLTYDDLSVPRSFYADSDTGEMKVSLTLEKRALQLFMKRLRKRFGEGIRFYAAGEYGDKTARPHYHLMLFGFKPPDLVPFGANELGQPYYRSESLEKIWPYGFVGVCDASWETCAYVARYVTKKLKGKEANFYDSFNIEPPFSLMSRKPGLARQYYDEHKDSIVRFQEINVALPSGGRKMQVPRYFKALMELDFPAAMERQKIISRRQAEEYKRLRLERTDLSYLELLDVMEDNKIKSIKSLKRVLD